MNGKMISAMDAINEAECRMSELENVQSLLKAVTLAIKAGDAKTADALIGQAAYWVDIAHNDLDVFCENIKTGKVSA